jgi:hypothetical protein
MTVPDRETAAQREARIIGQLIQEASSPRRAIETAEQRETRLKHLVAAYSAAYSEFRYRLAVTEAVTDEAVVRARFMAVTRRIGPA